MTGVCPRPWQPCQLEQAPMAQEAAGASHRALQEGRGGLELQGVLVAQGQDPALGSVELPATAKTG